MRWICKAVLFLSILCIASIPTFASHADETTLFDSNGNPVAYVAEDLTIYLWSGQPVAYLYSERGRDGLDVYGFNGKHLGWFVKGIIRNHDGDAECGVRSVVVSPKFEPFKSFKEFKPFKSFREFEPVQPIFSRSWANTPCRIFLAEGSTDD